MEEGEDLPFHFCPRGRVLARLEDEQNRLVFKTPTWLKTFTHAWLSDSITFHEFFNPSLMTPISGEPLSRTRATTISLLLRRSLILATGGKRRLSLSFPYDEDTIIRESEDGR